MPKVQRSEQEWRQLLDADAYRVCREKGTEAPFTGKYWNDHGSGEYACVCCGATLFRSQEKFDSGSGWPSFHAPAPEAPLLTREDASHGMVRTEVLCAQCDAHLGHVFPDGPSSTGMRYCINSVALKKDLGEE